MCTVLLPSGVKPIAVKKSVMSYGAIKIGCPNAKKISPKTIFNSSTRVLTMVCQPSYKTKTFYGIATWMGAKLLTCPGHPHVSGWTDEITREKSPALKPENRSQWLRGLRRRSTTVRLLGSWVRIPPGAWTFVCCECCVLSGRGLCDELAPRPGKSYRLWSVVVCKF